MLGVLKNKPLKSFICYSLRKYMIYKHFESISMYVNDSTI